MALEPREGALVEDGGDQAHVLDDRDRVTVAHRHAGRLLAAVLQGEETVEREVGHPHPGRVDPEDTAGFLHASPILAQACAVTVRPGPGRDSPRAPRPGRRRAGRPGRPGRTGRRPPDPARRPGSRAPRPGRHSSSGSRRRHDEARRQLGEELGGVARRPSVHPVPAAAAISASATASPPARHVVDGVHQRRGRRHRRPARRPGAATKAHTRARARRSRRPGPARCGGRAARWPSASPPAGRSRPRRRARPSSTTVSPADQASPGGGAWRASTRPSTPSTGVGSMSAPPLSL